MSENESKEVLSEDEMDNVVGGAERKKFQRKGRTGKKGGSSRPTEDDSDDESPTHTPPPPVPSFTVIKTQLTTQAPTRNPGGQVVGNTRGFTPRNP